jgi:hypothetical protein
VIATVGNHRPALRVKDQGEASDYSKGSIFGGPPV